MRGIAVTGQRYGRARKDPVPHEPEGHVVRRFRQEARDGLRHDPALLRPRPALDEHVEVELLRGQPFQGVAADVAEAALVHAFEQTLFEVGGTQLPRVVVAQDAFDVRGGQHFDDDVEHRVVVQRVADLLELVQEPLQHPAFDRVGGREVEDQAVLALAIAVDAAHPLLQPVGVPGDVVVEEDVADLEVDPLARRLRGHQDLDRALAELLLGVEPRAGLVARAGLHPAVDGPDREAPVPEPADEMVEGVAELREDEQALAGPVEEALVAEQVLKPCELRFRPGGLDRPGLPREVPELGDLLPYLPGVCGQGHRFEHPFEALALALLHLLDLVRAGEVRRRGAGQGLGLLQPFFEAPRAVFEASPQRMGAGRQPALVQRHQEAHRAGARIVSPGRGLRALALHEAGDLLVEVELRAVHLERDRMRDAPGEDLLRRPRAVRPALRKMDHGLLGAAEVEGRAAPLHRLADGPHVRVGVGVEELEEEAEVLRVALVRGGGEQKQVVRRIP